MQEKKSTLLDESLELITGFCSDVNCSPLFKSQMKGHAFYGLAER